MKLKKDLKNKPEDNLSKEVLRRHSQRLSSLKKAKDYFRREDFAHATKFYYSYLNAIAEYKRTTEKKLSSSLFSTDTELSEMLLISHTYWDLAKIFDRTPKLEGEFYKVLDKFVDFTIDKKFQPANARMIKRFIKNNRLVHKKDFEAALTRINVESKKCFVADYSLGQDHVLTAKLRGLKPMMAETTLGRVIINHYYTFSPMFVRMAAKILPANSLLARFLLYPILSIAYYFLAIRYVRNKKTINS